MLLQQYSPQQLPPPLPLLLRAAQRACVIARSSIRTSTSSRAMQCRGTRVITSCKQHLQILVCLQQIWLWQRPRQQPQPLLLLVLQVPMQQVLCMHRFRSPRLSHWCMQHL